LISLEMWAFSKILSHSKSQLNKTIFWDFPFMTGITEYESIKYSNHGKYF